MIAISLVICAYNAGSYLRSSVESALDQTYGDLEVLLVDDGSTDGSIETVADLEGKRLRIIRQANAGKPAAMNRAIEEASGEWIAIQDADDLVHPERIERFVAAVEAEPDLGAVFSGYELLIGDRRVAPINHRKDRAACRANIERFGMPSHDPTIMFRRDVGRDLGFDESLRIGEGYDFILRLGEVAPMRVIPDVLYSYRVTFDSVTRRDPAKRARYVRKVLEKACARRGLDYAKVFGPEKKRVSPDNGMAAHFMESVAWQKRDGQSLAAFRTAMQGVRFRPTGLRYYQALAYAMVPYWLLEGIRRRR